METEFFETTTEPDYRNEIDKRATRWIVFAGDRTPPEFKARFDGMRIGGEYLGHEYKTLAPSKGLLRRCQLTPMIEGLQEVNPDELNGDYSKVVSIEKRALSHDDPDNPNKTRRYVIYGYPKYPGDEIESLMQSRQGNSDDGLREVEVLRGVEMPKRRADGSFTECRALDYQTEIFPDWNRYINGSLPFFKTTIELSDYLHNRKPFVSDECALVIDTIIISNLQFELWAKSELGKQSVFVKSPPSATGKVYTWEKVHNQWFDDLNLNREEFLQPRKEIKETNEPSREDYQKRLERMESMFEVALPALGKLAEIAVANVPAETATSAAPDGEKRLCSAKTKSGDQCNSYAKGDSEFCRSHQN